MSAGYCHCTRCQRRTGTAASAQARLERRIRSACSRAAELVKEYAPGRRLAAEVFLLGVRQRGSGASIRTRAEVGSVRLGLFDPGPRGSGRSGTRSSTTRASGSRCRTTASSATPKAGRARRERERRGRAAPGATGGRVETLRLLTAELANDLCCSGVSMPSATRLSSSALAEIDDPLEQHEVSASLRRRRSEAAVDLDDVDGEPPQVARATRSPCRSRRARGRRRAP